MQPNQTDPCRPTRRFLAACRLTSGHMSVVANVTAGLVIAGLAIAGIRPPLKAMRDREMAEIRDQIILDMRNDKQRGDPLQIAVDVQECADLKNAMENPTPRNRLGLVIVNAEAGNIGLVAQYISLIGPRRDGKYNLNCDG